MAFAVAAVVFVVQEFGGRISEFLAVDRSLCLHGEIIVAAVIAGYVLACFCRDVTVCSDIFVGYRVRLGHLHACIGYAFQ